MATPGNLGYLQFSLVPHADLVESTGWSWHYGAFYQDAIRIGHDGILGYQQVQNSYGIWWQSLVGFIQHYTDLWSPSSYVTFTRVAQTSILVILLCWLYFGFRKPGHWWIGIFGFMICLIYHGGSNSAMGAVGSLLRRSGIVFFCISLYFVGNLAKRYPKPVVVTLHGIFTGLLALTSCELGLAIAVAGIVFWVTSEERLCIRKWLPQAAFFIAGLCFAVVSVMAFTRLEGTGMSLQTIFAWLGNVNSMGIGGGSLPISGLAFFGLGLSACLFFNGCNQWRRGPIDLEARVIFVCATLALGLYAFFAKGPSPSAVLTPLLPLGIAFVYACNSGSKESKNHSWLMPICLAASLAPTLYRYGFIEMVVAKNVFEEFSENASFSGDHFDSQIEREILKDLKVSDIPYTIVSPLYFQCSTGTVHNTRYPSEKPVYDILYTTYQKAGLTSLINQLAEDSVEVVLFHRNTRGFNTRELQFWEMKKREIWDGFSQLGYSALHQTRYENWEVLCRNKSKYGSFFGRSQ